MAEESLKDELRAALSKAARRFRISLEIRYDRIYEPYGQPVATVWR